MLKYFTKILYNLGFHLKILHKTLNLKCFRPNSSKGKMTQVLAEFVANFLGEVVSDPDFWHVSSNIKQQIQHLLLLVNLSIKYSNNIQLITDEHSKIKVSTNMQYP